MNVYVTIEITKEIHGETIITRNPQKGALKLISKQWHHSLGYISPPVQKINSITQQKERL